MTQNPWPLAVGDLIQRNELVKYADVKTVDRIEGGYVYASDEHHHTCIRLDRVHLDGKKRKSGWSRVNQTNEPTSDLKKIMWRLRNRAMEVTRDTSLWVNAGELLAVLSVANDFPPICTGETWVAPNGEERKIVQAFDNYVHCTGGPSGSLDAFYGWVVRTGARVKTS